MSPIQYRCYVQPIEQCLELLTDLIQNWHEVMHHNEHGRVHTDHCEHSTQVGICSNTCFLDVPRTLRDIITNKWVTTHGNPELFASHRELLNFPVGGDREYNLGWGEAARTKNKYKNMNRLSYAIYVRNQLVTELIKLRNDQAYLDELSTTPYLLFIEKYGV